MSTQQLHITTMHALARATARVAASYTEQVLDDEQNGLVGRRVIRCLEGERNVRRVRVAPGARLTADVLGGLALELVLGDGEHLTESLLNEVDVLVVVLDTGGNNEALARGHVVHDKLLEHARVNVVDVVGETESGHAERVVAVGGSLEELSLAGEGVELGQVVEEVVRLLVLGARDVGGKDTAGLESDINEHLEHVDDVVLDAVTLEVSGLLVIIHSHGAAGHLDHAVVDSLVGVLQRLEVRVLESEQSTGGLVGLISGADVHHEAYIAR